MTCDEFRSVWLDRSSTEEDAGWSAHGHDCPACAAWSARAALLDETLETVLIVAPPPELSARLRQLSAEPAAAAPIRDSETSMKKSASGLLLLVLMALGAIGLGSVTSTALAALAAEPANDLLLAAPMLLDGPLITYAQGLWTTALEACAALVLLGLLVNQALSTVRQSGSRAS